MARALGVIVTVAFAVLLARVGQLQLAPSDALLEHVAQRESGRSLQGPRGAILDRRGRPLSITRFAYRVIVDPTRLPEDPSGAIVSLADAMGERPDEIGSAIVRALVSNDERAAVRASHGLDAPPPEDERGVMELLKSRLGMQDPPTPDERLGPIVRLAEGEARPKPLIRYAPVGGFVEVEVADRIRAMRIPGVSLERRPVRAYTGGDGVASIVGKAGYADRTIELTGLIGAERALDAKLRGEDGSLRYVRDARGRPLWVERGSWSEPSEGEPVRLSIDVEIQRIALEELERGVEDADAAGGRIVIVEPATGEVLAIADIYRDIEDLAEFPWLERDPESDTEDAIAWIAPLGELAPDMRDRPRYRFLRPDPGRDVHPALGRNRCVEDVYEPGSTFKALAWSRAKTLGLLPDDEVIETGGKTWRTPYGRRVTDVYAKDELTWDEVLLHSSNIGMAQLAERVPAGEMRDAVVSFGMGSRTGIGLPGETGGLVTSAERWSKYTQTSVAMGYEVGVTPVQMARAYCALARTGELAGTLPMLRLTAAGVDGREGLTGEPMVATRILEPRIASHVREVLSGVADNMDRRMARFDDHQEPAYTMFGKSGTSEIALPTPEGKKRPRGFNGYLKNQHQSSFIAGAPAADPKLVVLVVIDDPGPALVRNQQHYGSWVAGPVVRRVMERTLRYLGVPPENAGDDADPDRLADAG